MEGGREKEKEKEREREREREKERERETERERGTERVRGDILSLPPSSVSKNDGRQPGKVKHVASGSWFALGSWQVSLDMYNDN